MRFVSGIICISSDLLVSDITTCCVYVCVYVCYNYSNNIILSNRQLKFTTALPKTTTNAATINNFSDNYSNKTTFQIFFLEKKTSQHQQLCHNIISMILKIYLFYTHYHMIIGYMLKKIQMTGLLMCELISIFDPT